MAISPLRQGSTAPPFSCTFIDDSNTAVNLSGLNASDLLMELYNTSAQTIITGGGSWTLPNGGGDGFAVYTLGPNDTAITGRYEVRVTIITTGGKLKPDVQFLTIV